MGPRGDRLPPLLSRRASRHGPLPERQEAEKGLRCLVLHLKEGVRLLSEGGCHAQEVRASAVRHMHGRRTCGEDVPQDGLGLREGHGVPAVPWTAKRLLQADEITLGGDLTIVKARRIRAGYAAGKAVVCSCPVSFLGGVDPSTGKILDGECESRNQSVSNKIFCFPYGKGSTVGSYAMYQLKLNGLPHQP